MRLMHLSDLHLGKRVNEFSMLEDQEYILEEILRAAEQVRPAAVIIAGDVYDKAVPPVEAVRLFDDFLIQLVRLEIPVFIISGNHDSPERIAFGAQLMEGSGVYMSPVCSGRVEPVFLDDEFGRTAVYSLPFLKPAHIRRFFPDEKVESYTDAMRVMISHMEPDPSLRSVLITHQFVTGASTCESEEISVGGTDNVDAAVFEPFDYVALGHLHGPQSVGRETVRYCGTPLKYSFSEAGHEKSITVAELREKGDITISTIPLVPKRNLRELRGSYMELTAKYFYDGTPTEDYLHIVLTDEEDVPDALGKLRLIYPNIMRLSYDNLRTQTAGELWGAEDCLPLELSPLQLVDELYEKQNNQSMSEEQKAFAEQLIEQVWEEIK